MNTDELIVKQANLISRARYSMPRTLRKLLALVFTKIQTKDRANMISTLRVGEIIKAMEIADTGQNYAMIRSIADDALRQIVTLELPDQGWVKFQWFSRIMYNGKTDKIEIKINPELHQYIMDLEDFYKLIPMAHINKLNSGYAMRIHEMVMADSGHMGKKGNKPNCWYTQISIAELRYRFEIKSHEYKLTAEFRRNCIDIPVTEINKANIELNVSVEYIRQGRKLVEVKFNCEYIPSGDPVPTGQPATESERLDNILIEDNKELWEECMKKARQQSIAPFIDDQESYYESWAMRLMQSDPRFKPPKKVKP